MDLSDLSPIFEAALYSYCCLFQFRLHSIVRKSEVTERSRRCRSDSEWFGFHLYSQLAKYFVEETEVSLKSGKYIIGHAKQDNITVASV